MAKGNKRYIRDAEIEECTRAKARTQAQVEAANAGITLVLEKMRALRDKLPRQDEADCNEVIHDLKRVRNSLHRTIDDLKEEVRYETEDEMPRRDEAAARAGPVVVKAEPADGAAGN